MSDPAIGVALWKVEELMQFLNIGRQTAYEMLHAENGLKPYAVRIGAGGKGLRVRVSGVMRWLEENQGRIDAQDFRAQEEDEGVPLPLQIRRRG